MNHPTNQSQPAKPNRRIFLFPLLAIGFALGIFVYQKINQRPAEAAPSSKHPSISTESTTNDSGQPASTLPPGCITAGLTQSSFSDAKHPLDPLMKIAKDSLQEIETNIRDYTTTMISHVVADDELQPEKHLFCKIRHANQRDGETATAFSVYTKFLKPVSNAGQEAIWVDGQNEGKLIAHPSGMLNVKRFYLDPDGDLAMEGNRYPIRDIGVRNLVVKMLEFGERDRQHDECEVRLTRQVKFNDRTCSLITVTHPIPRPHFDFHIAKIYIDDHWNIPIGYEGYLWPDEAQIEKTQTDEDKAAEQTANEKDTAPEPPLLEKYYYTDLQLNVGLTDADFDPGNESYNYPAW